MTIFRAGAEKMEILLRFEKDDRDIVVAPTREEVSKDDLPRITSTIASNNDDDMSHARTKEMPRTTTVETPESTFSNKDDVESAKDEDTFQVNPKQRDQEQQHPSIEEIQVNKEASPTDNKLVWGSRRVIHDDRVKEREWWVYLVALFILLTTTAGLGCVVFLVFGAASPQIEYQEELLMLVQGLSEDADVFSEPSSAQSLALNWLANEDEYQVDAGDTARVQSRYSLAVLYFATNGATQWMDSLKFLSSEHECEWHDQTRGVFCDGENYVVTDLIVHSNNLRGSIPIELSTLSALKTFDLGDNRLTGTLPSYEFGELESMIMTQNSLEASVPESFTKMTNLKVLDLSANLLESQPPQNIQDLTNLEVLKLGENRLSGLGEEFFVLSNLRELNLTSNSFSGNLDFLKSLSLLEVLDLSSNAFEADLDYEKFSTMTNLREMVLANNQIVGQVPSSLGKLTKLEYLNVAQNLLTGFFPWTAFPESKLSRLIMTDNLFAGQLPLDIFRFTALKVLNFDRNHLSGMIPLGIGGSTSLEELHIAGNEFTGTLPASLGNLAILSVFDVSDNNLDGQLPDALSNFSNLVVLDVHGNNFSGSVPQGMEDYDVVKRIALHDNNITGSIDFLCTIVSDPIISADCAGQEPQVICTCCDICLQR
jgi:Leucine-rich repeat (LRR) protein